MDRKGFFKNGLMMTLVNLALRTVSLGFGAYVSGTVGAEGVGLYTLINTVYAFAFTFATSGITLTVTRLVAEDIGRREEGNIGRTLRGATLYSLLFGGLATLLLALLSGTIATYALGDVRAIMPLSILSLSLIPASLTGVLSGYFIGVRRVVPNAIIQVTGQLLRVALTVVLLMSFTVGGTEGAIIALAIGTSITELAIFIISFIAFVIDKFRYTNKKEAKRGVDFIPVAKNALPLGISAYIRSLLLSFEHSLITARLLLHGESRAEALAKFGIVHGMSLPMILYPMSPLTSFSGLLVPEFAEADAGGARARASRIASSALSATLTYATLASTLLFFFSEELGYTVYSSYEAGIYIALLSLVVPLMYLDHVTDSILKGIGEHVYSMWVNIADSFLSVLLVFILIPVMGIAGYAVVIIVMELFNFILSIVRLSRRIRLTVDLLSSLVIPAISSVFGVLITRALFVPLGSVATFGGLFLRLVFAVCAFVAINIVNRAIYSLIRKERKASPSQNSREQAS